MKSDNKKSFFESIYPIAAFVLGLTVMFVSLSRATLEITAAENNQDKLRLNPIALTINYSDGTTEPTTYKLPEIGMLPNNPFYGFKRVRDFLWITFSSGNDGKSKVALLIADKKIAESRELLKENQNTPALDASQEAVDKLKYSGDLAAKVKDTDPQYKSLHKQIYVAGLVYKEIIDAYADTFDLDMAKYQKIVNSLDDFNASQEQEKENWSY